jgi:glycosyltransferase involved in cell wall biosynthesis
MRIVLVTDFFAPASDATAETARQVSDALVAEGHELLVLTGTAGKGSYRSAEVVRLRRLPNPVALHDRVRAFRPDAVLVLRPRALGVAALRALEHSGIPVTVLDPTPLTPRIGTTLASSRSGARLLGMVGLQARVWAPGVRTDEHHPGLRSEELHHAWTRGAPHLVVGYAGQVGASTSKHVRRLARVAALDGVRLVVLGCGAGTGTLKQAGARIVGECGGLELARAVASLDVFVQPRKSETGLDVVRKALASGVPVVAFDTATIREVVVDGHNGLLVPPGQGRSGVADAVARLADDTALRASLAGRARDSVAGRTWADAVEELVEICGPLATAV